MSLSDHVRAFTDGDGGFVTGGGKKIVVGNALMSQGAWNVAMACHVAMFLWLYLAKHAGAFPAISFLDDNAPQHFINNLLRFGHPGRVTSRSRPLADDVLIFADPDAPTVGLHSCVMLRSGNIAGYNQVDWLTGGQRDTYTEHDPDDINWVPRSCLFTPRRAQAGGGERYIWAVREATALGRMT